MKIANLALLAPLAVWAPSASADQVMWQSADFDGAWVEIIDRAQNGCWTNLIESREYSEGKLELAGFSISEKPETSAQKMRCNASG